MVAATKKAEGEKVTPFSTNLTNITLLLIPLPLPIYKCMSFERTIVTPRRVTVLKLDSKCNSKGWNPFNKIPYIQYSRCKRTLMYKC